MTSIILTLTDTVQQFCLNLQCTSLSLTCQNSLYIHCYHNKLPFHIPRWIDNDEQNVKDAKLPIFQIWKIIMYSFSTAHHTQSCCTPHWVYIYCSVLWSSIFTPLLRLWLEILCSPSSGMICSETSSDVACSLTLAMPWPLLVWEWNGLHTSLCLRPSLLLSSGVYVRQLVLGIGRQGLTVVGYHDSTQDHIWILRICKITTQMV